MTTVTTATTTQGAVLREASTWADLAKSIDANHGVALVPMETLRRLEGAQRLGVHVLNSISKRLRTLGLGHLPNELPNRQDQDAILYRLGSPASEVITAVREGVTSPQDVRNTYEALYKMNALPEVSSVVHREELDDKLSTAAQSLFDLLGPAGQATVMGSRR